MFFKKVHIYSLISKHNKKFSKEVLFLSKRLQESDRKFMKYIFMPSFFVLGVSSIILIFMIRDKTSTAIGIICLLIILVFTILRSIYFNEVAKKDTNYKVKNSKFKDLFKSWFTNKQRKKQLKKIRKHYSSEQFHSLIETAKNEYEFQKSRNNFKHNETIILSVLAILLTLTMELNLINDWLLKMNNGNKVSLEDRIVIFKAVVGIALMILFLYLYTKKTLLQQHKDKKSKLKEFIQTMQLAESFQTKK